MGKLKSMHQNVEISTMVVPTLDDIFSILHCEASLKLCYIKLPPKPMSSKTLHDLITLLLRLLLSLAPLYILVWKLAVVHTDYKK